MPLVVGVMKVIYFDWSVACSDGSLWLCFRSASNEVGWDYCEPIEQELYNERNEQIFPSDAVPGYRSYIVLETQVWIQKDKQISGSPIRTLKLAEMEKMLETEHVLENTYFCPTFRYYEDANGNLCTLNGIIKPLEGKKCRHVSSNQNLTVVLFEDSSVYAYQVIHYGDYAFLSPMETWFQVDINPELNIQSVTASSGCVYFITETSLYIWGCGYGIATTDVSSTGGGNLRQVTFFEGKKIQKLEASSSYGNDLLCLCEGLVYTWNNSSGHGGTCFAKTGRGEISRVQFFDNKKVLDIALPYGKSLSFVLCDDGVYSWNFKQDGEIITEPRKLEIFSDRMPVWFSTNSMRSVCAKRPAIS